MALTLYVSLEIYPSENCFQLYIVSMKTFINYM